MSVTDNPLILCALRGNKTYMHSIDILSQLIEITNAQFNFCLELTGRTDCGISVHKAESEDLSHLDRCGRFQHGEPDKVERFYLVRRPDIVPTQKVPFDPNLLTSGAHINDSYIEAPRQADFSFGDQTLALAEKLMCLRHPSRKWWLAQIEFNTISPAISNVGFKITRRLGTKFWTGALLADGKTVGKVILTESRA